MDPHHDELWFGLTLPTDLLGLLALVSGSSSLARWLSRRRAHPTTTAKPTLRARPLGVALRELPPAR